MRTMKGKQLCLLVNILAIIFLTSILFVRRVNPHPHSITKQASSSDTTRSQPSIGASRFSHKLVTKRETDKNEQFCILKRVDLACSSGYYQAFTDASLNCGRSDGIARKLANYCAQNERGEYCLKVYHEVTHDNDLSIIDSNCPARVASSCPSNCREQLQILKEKLGCCSVSYLRDYYTLLQQPTRYDSAFDYRVWNLCGISLPTPCELPNLSEVDRDCTNEEFHRQLYTQRICVRGDAGQAYINGLLSIAHAEQCNYTAIEPDINYLVEKCAFNAHGEECDLLDIRGALYYNLSNIDARCSNYSPKFNASSCSQVCTRSIMEAKNSVGCCVNLYNNSDANSYYGTRYRDALSYDLWNSCGVQVPGVCESTLSLSSSISAMRGISMGITTFAALMVLITVRDNY